jgi:hypothetical protein
MKSVVLNMSPLATAARLQDLKMPSDMEIVPISRDISSEVLVGNERLSIEENPSGPDGKTAALPSRAL